MLRETETEKMGRERLTSRREGKPAGSDSDFVGLQPPAGS